MAGLVETPTTILINIGVGPPSVRTKIGKQIQGRVYKQASTALPVASSAEPGGCICVWSETRFFTGLS